MLFKMLYFFRKKVKNTKIAIFYNYNACFDQIDKKIIQNVLFMCKKSIDFLITYDIIGIGKEVTLL